MNNEIDVDRYFRNGILDHPLLSGSYRSETEMESLLQVLKFKLELASRAKGEGNFTTYVMSHEGGDRGIAFDEIASNLDRITRLKLLATVWNDPGSLGLTGGFIAYWIRECSTGGVVPDLMNHDELRFLESLPSSIEVYRAHYGINQEGVCYTLNEADARLFQELYGYPLIDIARVRREAVSAVFLRRGYAELLCLPEFASWTERQ